jgi:serine phosphatase RsbU (regulator of sigma subunit)
MPNTYQIEQDWKEKLQRMSKLPREQWDSTMLEIATAFLAARSNSGDAFDELSESNRRIEWRTKATEN